MINPADIQIGKLPSVALSNKSELPAISSIYFAIDAQSVIQYIGRTTNLNRRWLNHHRYVQFTEMTGVKIAYIDCSEDLLDDKVALEDRVHLSLVHDRSIFIRHHPSRAGSLKQSLGGLLMKLLALLLSVPLLAFAQPASAQTFEEFTPEFCATVLQDAHTSAATGEITAATYDMLWEFGQDCNAIAYGRQWAGEEHDYFTVLRRATVSADAAVLDEPVETGFNQGTLRQGSRILVLQGTYAQDFDGYSWYQVKITGHEHQIKSWIRGDYLIIDAE